MPRAYTRQICVFVAVFRTFDPPVPCSDLIVSPFSPTRRKFPSFRPFTYTQKKKKKTVQAILTAPSRVEEVFCAVCGRG